MDNLKGVADAHRLWHNHLAVAKKGRLPSSRTTHQALTEGGFGTQHHPAHWALRRGCCVEFDPIENLFPSQPGHRTKSPFIALANHADTSPAGEKFDKTFGVPAGLGALENTAAMPALPSTKVVSEAFRNTLVVAGARPAGMPFAPGEKSVSPTRQTSSV